MASPSADQAASAIMALAAFLINGIPVMWTFSSFRRKPESMVVGSITVVAACDARFRLAPE